jgi:hypothetical protein
LIHDVLGAHQETRVLYLLVQAKIRGHLLAVRLFGSQ